MKVWIKDNHKILNFDGGKEIDLGTVFYLLRPNVAKWQHQAIWSRKTFVILLAAFLAYS
jgi:hypothetical protein